MSINKLCNHKGECGNYCGQCGKPLKERCLKCGEMEKIGRKRCETDVALLRSAEEARDFFIGIRYDGLEVRGFIYYVLLYIFVHWLLLVLSLCDIISVTTVMRFFILGPFTTFLLGLILLHMLLQTRKTKLKPYWNARFLEKSPQHARILKAENPRQ